MERILGISKSTASPFHENVVMPDPEFPVRFFCLEQEHSASVFNLHWHEQIEFIYLKKGNMQIECDNHVITLYPGDLAVINSNQYHSSTVSEGPLLLYCIIVDFSVLNSRFFDACEHKYILPVFKNHILFQNQISNERQVIEPIEKIAQEYTLRETGYELAVKAALYNLMVVLFRKYIDKTLTIRETETRNKNTQRINVILKYIQENYMEEISAGEISSLVGVSQFHFCRLFKQYTGKTLTEYINSIRINAAIRLLEEKKMTITEIAMSVGFNDINYFSRVFKKHAGSVPSAFRKCKLGNRHNLVE